MLLLGSAAQGYGNLDEHESSAAVGSACARCSSRLGHALGDPWTSCVVDELLKEQDEAKQAGRPYFPMVPHVYQPLAPKHGAYPQAELFKHNPNPSPSPNPNPNPNHDPNPDPNQAELFKHLLRNCTCDFDDGGSRPLRRQWVGTLCVRVCTCMCMSGPLHMHMRCIHTACGEAGCLASCVAHNAAHTPKPNPNPNPNPNPITLTLALALALTLR